MYRFFEWPEARELCGTLLGRLILKFLGLFFGFVYNGAHSLKGCCLGLMQATG